jgi:hypothetical protein
MRLSIVNLPIAIKNDVFTVYAKRINMNALEFPDCDEYYGDSSTFLSVEKGAVLVNCEIWNSTSTLT